MAERCEVVSVVDYHNGLSWRYDPSWVEYYIKKHGVEGFKEEALRQFNIGIDRAIETFHLLNKDYP